jgi:hypothetical protein
VDFFYLFRIVYSVENVILCCSDVNISSGIVLLVAEIAFSINLDLSKSLFVQLDVLFSAVFEFETVDFCVSSSFCGDCDFHSTLSINYFCAASCLFCDMNE